MSYLHIENLYKNQDILLFRECYALEKIHGTSANISHTKKTAYYDGEYPYNFRFFSGGAKYESFIALFNQDSLREKLAGIDCVIYGEAYGGKEQGMSATYGKQMKFIAFDVKINDCWLSVPKAEEFCQSLGLEFVHYRKVTTDIDSLNQERDADSNQAFRNGVGWGHKREGVVLRPLIELTTNNGSRLIAKHKRDEFKETKTPREISPEQLKKLSDAEAIASEWVTPMRIAHVLDKIPGACMEKMKDIMSAMMEDIEREAAGEIVMSPEARRAIGKATAFGIKNYFQTKLSEV